MITRRQLLLGCAAAPLIPLLGTAQAQPAEYTAWKFAKWKYTAASRSDETKIVVGDQKRFPTGFPTLDKLLNGGIGAGESMLVLGAAWTGKTSFAMTVMDKNEGLPFKEKLQFMILDEDITQFNGTSFYDNPTRLKQVAYDCKQKNRALLVTAPISVHNELQRVFDYVVVLSPQLLSGTVVGHHAHLTKNRYGRRGKFLYTIFNYRMNENES